MTKWKKSVFKLDANHKWKAKPGYKIFVADWGALRFDVPGDWIVTPGSTSFKFQDREPPDDNCTLEVSVNRVLIPGIDWSGLPLPQLLADVLAADDSAVTSRGEIIHEKRADFELAWTETRFVEDGRAACSRACLARRDNLHPLITMAFWLDDAEQFVPVWDEVIGTLQLGPGAPGLSR